MGRYLLSPRAQEDLDDIWDFSAESWGAEKAESYLRGLWIGIQAIADDPKRGQQFDLRPGYYRFSIGRHVLFFKPVDDGVHVFRILHQSMDFERHI